MKIEYLDLLYRQVTDEIYFLLTNGHDQLKPTVPCIFCIESHGKFNCDRLPQLRSFMKFLDATNWKLLEITGSKNPVNIVCLPILDDIQLKPI